MASGSKTPAYTHDCDNDERRRLGKDVEQDFGSNSASIISELEKRLRVDSTHESLDQVYLLYCEYARRLGFRVRKGSQRSFSNSIELKSKLYNCSCEGHSEAKHHVGRLPHYQKKVIRSDCKARLRVVREREEEQWKVSEFIKEHNHELNPHDHQSSLSQMKLNLSYAKKSVLEMCNSDGIGVSGAACRRMEKEFGGPQNVGFKGKADYAEMSRLRKHSKLDQGDSNSLLEFLTNKSNRELYFYWNAQFDDKCRLINFFFRDYQCLVDYEFFGDVLSVDAMYRINKNNSVFVSFMGVNHHRENVMLGLAFLSDETTESFMWLLETFMKSMDKKEPQVIVSDQCRALMDGIDNIFQTASHRINQDTPSHSSSLKGNDEFKKMWHHCMNGCETEDEFENSWQVMIETYDLSGDAWFSNTYSLRRKWASVFTNDQFSAGVCATLHSEILKGLCSSSTSIYKFILDYQQLQADLRSSEAEEDTLCHEMPEQFIENNQLLMHAAEIYTRNVYETFEHEALYSLNVDVIQHPDYSTLVEDLEFNVSSESQSITRERRVIFTRHNHHATCTCRTWETEGMLCRHILKIYYLMNVKRLPEQYIIKRWTRRAKVRDMESHAPCRDMAPDEWAKYITRKYYDMLMEFDIYPELRSLVVEKIGCLLKDMDAFLKAERSTNATFASQEPEKQAESQCEVDKMDLSLQLNHSFFDGQGCEIQASQKTCSFPNAQRDRSRLGGIQGKGKRKLELFDEDIL